MGGGGGGRGNLWFKLKNDGDTAVVRFLEQDKDVKWCWMHEVPKEGAQWGDEIPCRDQKRTGQERCPGCEQGLDRSFTGYINLIWRDAPMLQRDGDGRPVRDGSNQYVIAGTEDQLAVWEAGITIFEILDSKNTAFKGLTSRDFRITRRGRARDPKTRYDIEPMLDNDGNSMPVPMTDADKKLAADKPDLKLWVTPPSYESWSKEGYWESSGWSTPGNGQPQQKASPDVAPFMFGEPGVTAS